MDEFALIRRYFAADTSDPDVRVGIGDDGAVLQPTDGRELVVVVDTLVEGVHFPTGFNAADLGFRSVAVNLSDVAAMGATPRWMTLALTLTGDAATDVWLESFASGLKDAAGEFSVALVGGDTTRGENLVVTVQIIADVVAGQSLRRDTAKPGDLVFVTGTVGDAAAGLTLLGSATGSAGGELESRFCRPAPRVDFGRLLRGVASAAIDVSDGLIGDLKKLAAASGCAAQVNIDRVPRSDALDARFDRREAEQFALGGGDDYELCFTAPAAAEARIADLAAAADVAVTRIGRLVAGTGVSCFRAGLPVDYDDAGYRHFQEGPQ